LKMCISSTTTTPVLKGINLESSRPMRAVVGHPAAANPPGKPGPAALRPAQDGADRWPISRIHPASLRSQISTVLQDNLLLPPAFERTSLLRIYRRPESRGAARLANATFYHRAAQGYDTVLGEPRSLFTRPAAADSIARPRFARRPSSFSRAMTVWTRKTNML